MAKDIGNPLSWLAGTVGSAAHHLVDAVEAASPGRAAKIPEVRTISARDLREILRKGWDDMATFRTDVAFLCVMYPIIGFVIAALALHGGMVHLVFPALSGCALVGPVAGVGLYEMSRRREAGLETNWLAIADVLRSPRFGGIVVLALMHGVIFMAWVMAANLIYALTLGPEPPVSTSVFVADVFGSGAGWAMIVLGVAVGFVFAAGVLAMSVVSFPLLMDRDVGVALAIVTSVAVARRNPGPVAAWGAIIAGALVLGSLPLLLGLILVLPVLSHATWHPYRAAVA